jgi:pimeloyl-ACP methyl ester carboxylesterase
MASMGEKHTIVRRQRPGRLGREPRGAAGHHQPFGFRRPARIAPDELRRLTVPTLLIWGDRDPVGAAGVAQAAARLIPDAQPELRPAGHVPYLAHPERAAELVASFVRSS